MEKKIAKWVLVISLCLYIGLIPSKTDVYSLFSKALLASFTSVIFYYFLLFCLSVNKVVGAEKTPNSAQKWTNFFTWSTFLMLPYCPSKRCLCLSLSLSISLFLSLLCIFTLTVYFHLWSTRIQKSPMVVMMMLWGYQAFFPFWTRKCGEKRSSKSC